MPDTMIAWLAVEAVTWLMFAAAQLSGSSAPAPTPDPLTVHEVRTASDEEIIAAGAELPELLRRAEEAVGRPRS